MPLPAHAIGAHHGRGGWPEVHASLAAAQDVNARVLLEDFLDLNIKKPECNIHYSTPWVGIIHQPARIDSPIRGDAGQVWDRILHYVHPNIFAQCRGFIVLSHDLAAAVRKKTTLPVHVLKHPTVYSDGNRFPTWIEHLNPAILQAGFYLRDTRAIYKIVPQPDYTYYRLEPQAAWQSCRDAELAHHWGSLEINPCVANLPRQFDHDYDDLLSTSIVLTHLFGASANNVVLECMARHTPILVNKLPAVVEYLGADYPLYIPGENHLEQLHHIKTLHEWLTREKVREAHKYLRELPKLEIKDFVSEVSAFCQAVV
jgi:hypothetical protein